MRRPEFRDVTDWQVSVTLNRRGHADPFANGALVRYVHATGTLFSDLDPDLSNEGGRMKNEPGLSGMIVDRVWHVDHYELFHAEIDPVIDTRRTKPHLRNVNLDLHYHVLFPAGLFWARFDWLEEVPPV